MEGKTLAPGRGGTPLQSDCYKEVQAIVERQIRNVASSREKLLSERDELEKRLRDARSMYENALEVRRLELRLDDFIRWANASAQDCRMPVSTTPAAADKEAADKKVAHDGLRASGTALDDIRTRANPYLAKHPDLVAKVAAADTAWKNLLTAMETVSAAMLRHQVWRATGAYLCPMNGLGWWGHFQSKINGNID
eukprot:m.1585099 g.1585099  ORF g.1585099 m.1585099 type:complete len:195 (+) comp25322_c0_seq16:375-959(+)